MTPPPRISGVGAVVGLLSTDESGIKACTEEAASVEMGNEDPPPGTEDSVIGRC